MLILRAFDRWRHIPPAILTEWFAPVLARYARLAVKREPTPPTEWKRILITGDNHVGDVLMRTPSLPALRRGFPAAELFFLTSPTSADLLERNPHIDHVLAYARSDCPSDLAPEHQRRLRELEFDAALITNAVRYWPYLKAALEWRIPNRAAFIHKGLSGWVTHPVPISFPDKLPAYVQKFVAHVTNVAPSWDLRPRVFLEGSDFVEAEQTWQSLGLSDNGRVAAFFCTSRQEAELWPAERWSECMRLLQRKLDAAILLIGAASERDQLTVVAQQSKVACRVLAGALTLRGLIAMLRKCSVVVCPDSGSRHLGNAANTPVVFLRNLAAFEGEGAPYCDTELDAIEDPGGRLRSTTQRKVLREVSAAHVSDLAAAHARLPRES